MQIPWLFPDFSQNSFFPWPSTKFPDFCQVWNFPDFSLTAGHPVYWFEDDNKIKYKCFHNHHKTRNNIINQTRASSEEATYVRGLVVLNKINMDRIAHLWWGIMVIANSLIYVILNKYIFWMTFPIGWSL